MMDNSGFSDHSPVQIFETAPDRTSFVSYCIQQLDSFPVSFWLFLLVCSFFVLCDKVFFILPYYKGICFKISNFTANYFYLSKLTKYDKKRVKADIVMDTMQGRT